MLGKMQVLTWLQGKCVCLYSISITEQQYFEIEKQLIDSNTKLEAESSSNEQLKEQLKELGIIALAFKAPRKQRAKLAAEEIRCVFDDI